jgi:hypothetical protein
VSYAEGDNPSVRSETSAALRPSRSLKIRSAYSKSRLSAPGGKLPRATSKPQRHLG